MGSGPVRAIEGEALIVALFSSLLSTDHDVHLRIKAVDSKIWTSLSICTSRGTVISSSPLLMAVSNDSATIEENHLTRLREDSRHVHMPQQGSTKPKLLRHYVTMTDIVQ